jgi:hypothetical protein
MSVILNRMEKGNEEDSVMMIQYKRRRQPPKSRVSFQGQYFEVLAVLQKYLAYVDGKLEMFCQF